MNVVSGCRLITGSMIVVLAAACGGPSTTPVRDASAVYACEKFSRAIRDAKAGILTDRELRQRLQEVHEDARLSDPAVAPGVKEGAERVLAIVTGGQKGDFTEAVNALVAACNRPGAQRAQ
jgi:hypothetical protein